MSTPDFSIIIPTFNRPEQLQKCLGAIAVLDTEPARYEVIVVDDHGKLPARPVCDQFTDRLDLSCHRSPVNGGPATARNVGAAKASGRFLFFTDDDCLPAPDWLNILGEHLLRDENLILGGHTVNHLTENPYSEASEVLLDYLYQHLLTTSGEPVFFTSNNLAFSRRIFEEIGGFDATIGRAASEDREICHRLQIAGHTLTFEPLAIVNHAHDLSLSKFWKQHFWYGSGALQFRRRLRQKSQPSPRLESLRFYVGMFSYPFSQMSLLAAIRCSALIFLSQVAHTMGFLWHSVRDR